MDTGGLKHATGLTLTLARREVAAEFKGTALGRLWSLINPLATIAVFAIIFGVVFRASVPPGVNSGIDSFAVWIGIGVLTWGVFSRIVNNGMNALVANAGLLTKVYFPRAVLVVAAALAQTYNFLFEILALTIVVGIIGGPEILLYVALSVVFLIFLAGFALGLALILSVVTVYFRDISHLWSIFMQIWMYASGVIFPASMLETAQQTLFEKGWEIGGQPLPLVTLFHANPAEVFLRAFRTIFYDFAVPGLPVWGTCAAWSLGILGLGALVFRRYSPRIVEEL